MTFLHPILAAAGIACVAIPIIIHILMRRRRRPVAWAAMRFLLEAYRQQRRRVRLEQLLLLAARCLLVALIGLAIARPLLGRAGILGGRGSVSLYLLIDNGLASTASASQGEAGGGDAALARHKAAAVALLGQLDPASGDRAGLIALGGPASAAVVPPSTSISGLRQTIADLNATDSPTDIPGGIAIVRSAIDSATAEPGGRVIVAILSDFLAGSADTERKLAELGSEGGGGAGKVETIILASKPAESGPANVGIAGLEPLQPIVIASKKDSGPRQSPVRVLLHRSGGGTAQAAATTVRFGIETPGQARPTPAGQAVVRWTPGQTEATATVPVTFAATGASGSIVLTAAIDPDAVAGDNLWRRPVEMRQSLRVGLISPRRTGPVKTGVGQYEPADWFRLALQPVDPSTPQADAEIEITEIEPAALDAGRLSGLDAAIVARPDALPEGSWKRLRAFADAGGMILVCPPAAATVHLWVDAMTRDLGLSWSAGREAKAEPAEARIAIDRVPGSGDLLAMLDAELRDLAGPVRVFKVLPVEAGVRGGGGAGSGGEVLLRLTDGSPLLLAAVPGSKDAGASGGAQHGLVVMLTAAPSLDWTDLQTKPLMVALMQEVVRQGVGRARGAFAALAGGMPELPARAVELRTQETPARVVKAAGGHAAEPVRNAGVWRAVDETGASRGLVVVNADPAGGRCDPRPSPAIASWLGASAGGKEVKWLGAGGVGADAGPGVIRATLERGDDAGRLALPLLIAALALGLLELAMARWFSHATVASPAGGAA